MGKHWCVESGDTRHYIRGTEAATAEEAEKQWRERLRLYFIDDLTVRRTTKEEDEQLAVGEALQ